MIDKTLKKMKYLGRQRIRYTIFVVKNDCDGYTNLFSPTKLFYSNINYNYRVHKFRTSKNRVEMTRKRIYLHKNALLF